jgi:hypothetical protein
MAVEVAALATFSDRLGSASWFSMIGEPLTPAEQVDAAHYMSCLGLDDVATQGIGSWEAAETCIKSTDWNTDWWDAEDRLRANLLERAEQRFGKLATLEALSGISEQVSDVVHGAAAVAAARGGVADSGLIRAAAGAATMACYQAAVGIAADLAADPTDDNPFIAKYRLFEAGHWPLCVRGTVFYVF